MTQLEVIGKLCHPVAGGGFCSDDERALAPNNATCSVRLRLRFVDEAGDYRRQRFANTDFVSDDKPAE